MMKIAKKAGIYSIICKTNGKLYIGSTVNFYKRWCSNHKINLKNNKHKNQHLQNSWNKYGEKNFIFEIIEIFNNFDKENKKHQEELRLKESWWIEYTECWRRELGYNINRIINNRKVVSQETKKKLSTYFKNNPSSNAGLKGEKNPTSKRTWEEVYKIRDKYLNENYLASELAKEFNINITSICRIINNVTWFDENYQPLSKEQYKKRVYKKDAKNTRSILTYEQVLEIREKYAPYTYPSRELAKEYGVSNSTIQNIIRNKRWNKI